MPATIEDGHGFYYAISITEVYYMSDLNSIGAAIVFQEETNYSISTLSMIDLKFQELRVVDLQGSIPRLCCSRYPIKIC